LTPRDPLSHKTSQFFTDLIFDLPFAWAKPKAAYMASVEIGKTKGATK